MQYALFDEMGNRITTYVEGIHNDIPIGVIEISDEDQNLYVTNEYIRGEDGKPQKKPVYIPTTEEFLTAIRAERNRFLDDCDWTQLPDISLTAEQRQAWAIYRQALRDMPETCDPQNPVWPTKPE